MPQIGVHMDTVNQPIIQMADDETKNRLAALEEKMQKMLSQNLGLGAQLTNVNNPTQSITDTQTEEHKKEIEDLKNQLKQLEKRVTQAEFNGQIKEQLAPNVVKSVCLTEEKKHFIFRKIDKFYEQKKKEIEDLDASEEIKKSSVEVLDQWREEAKSRRTDKIMDSTAGLTFLSVGAIQAIYASATTGSAAAVVKGVAVGAIVAAPAVPYLIIGTGVVLVLVGGVWVCYKIYKHVSNKRAQKQSTDVIEAGVDGSGQN